MRDLAEHIAILETIEPTLGVTEQVPAVHQLNMHDETPVILHVDENEPGVFDVYFGIEGEPYYFAIVVRKENDRLIASASYIEAAVRVYLSIHSTLLDPSSITERVQLAPTRSDRIGEKRFPKSSVKFKDNRWYFEPQKDIPGDLGSKLKFLLDRLEPIEANIASLQNECEIYLSICYKGYKDWMGGWHIDKETIRRIAALGAEVDLDLYAYGDWDLP